MINVFQIILDDAKSNELNRAGSWDAVEWGKTYLDLTFGTDGDVMPLIEQAAAFGLIRHTMTIDTDDNNVAFECGNGYSRAAEVTTYGRFKSASVGDIFINTDVQKGGCVVAGFGFNQLTTFQCKVIETLVPQKMGVA